MPTSYPWLPIKHSPAGDPTMYVAQPVHLANYEMGFYQPFYYLVDQDGYYLVDQDNNFLTDGTSNFTP